MPIHETILQSPQFQRLRFIKQLGTVALIFPNANHSRLEHSRGVAELTHRFVLCLLRRWRRRHHGGQPISPKDFRFALLAQVAGLCHDIGHGPWSHAYDTAMAGRLPCHEERGILLLRTFFHHLFDHEARELELVEALILGGDRWPDSQWREYRWAREILAAKGEHCVDTDRMDYILRDAQRLPPKYRLYSLHKLKAAQSSVLARSQVDPANETILMPPCAVALLMRQRQHVITHVFKHPRCKELDQMLIVRIRALQPPDDQEEEEEWSPKRFCQLTDELILS